MKQNSTNFWSKKISLISCKTKFLKDIKYFFFKQIINERLINKKESLYWWVNWFQKFIALIVWLKRVFKIFL